MANEKNQNPISSEETGGPIAPVTPIAVGEHMRAAQDSLLTIAPGEVIKEAGVELPHGFVVMEGSVEVLCPIATLTGVVERSLGLVNKYEHFNVATLMGEDGRLDKRCKFVARTMTVLAAMKPPFNLNAKVAPTLLYTMAKVERRRSDLYAEVLVEEVKDKEKLRADLERSQRLEAQRHGEELLEKDQELASEVERVTKRDQRIRQLSQENHQLRQASPTPQAQELDRLDIGDSIEVNQLKAQATDLLHKLGDARNKIERYKERVNQLLPIAEQKARLTTEQLNRDEKIALAIVELSNFFFELVPRQLTDKEVEKVRKLISAIRPNWNDEEMASLDGTLIYKEIVRDLTKVGGEDRISSIRPEPPPLPQERMPFRRALTPPAMPRVVPPPMPRPDGSYAIYGEIKLDAPDIETEEIPSRQTLDWRDLVSAQPEPCGRETLVGGLFDDARLDEDKK